MFSFVRKACFLQIRCIYFFLNYLLAFNGFLRLFTRVCSHKILPLFYLQINRQKLMGEINFFPLNRLIVKPRKEVNDPVRCWFI